MQSTLAACSHHGQRAKCCWAARAEGFPKLFSDLVRASFWHRFWPPSEPVAEILSWDASQSHIDLCPKHYQYIHELLYYYCYYLLPLLPTIPLFFHKHHPLFGLISPLLISIKTCAYVLLSWYTLRGEALRLLPAPPHPLLFFNRFPLLPTLSLFFISIIVYLASFYLFCCPYRLVPMYFFHVLSWYALQGTPPPAFVFHRLPLLPTILPLVHKHRFLGFIFSFFFFQKYPSRLVPMCFFLDRLVLTCNISIETCAYVHLSYSWYALRGEALLPTIPFFLHKHHRLFGLISSLLISIETSAYVLLSRYALRGRRRALPPAPPHPLLFLNRPPLLPTLLPFS